MTLHLFDTATRSLREFVPLAEGKVGMYICGLTTQGEPHIGHARFAVAFDILRRWLERGYGYDVTLVRNVTDIDDKILRKAAENDREWWAWSYQHERSTNAGLEALGVLPATYEPRATGHIPEMHEIMRRLIERGHAYPAPDGSGDVYFDVQSWPTYGELTHQRISDMQAAEDADPRGKRDPRDFALWKGWKDGEPESASWPSEWGRGRPGWHLECSAMAWKYLGETFDIHGGAVDLRFPHHENEQAQSRAAGFGFARYWLHNAWLTLSGEKMSKSLGNTMLLSEMVRTLRPIVLRYYLGAAHYRSTIEYGEGSLAEAEAAVERVEGFVTRAVEQLSLDLGEVRAQAAVAPLPPAFAQAMDDDLNVSAALAVVFDHIRRGNSALDEATDARTLLVEVLAMTAVLGVDPTDPVWRTGGSQDARAMAVLAALVADRLEARTRARQERDFATADAIRDQLAALGIEVADTAAGARWSLIRNGSS